MTVITWNLKCLKTTKHLVSFYVSRTIKFNYLRFFSTIKKNITKATKTEYNLITVLYYK